MTYEMKRIVVCVLGLILLVREILFGLLIGSNYAFSVYGWHPHITLSAIGIGLIVGSVFAEK